MTNTTKYGKAEVLNRRYYSVRWDEGACVGPEARILRHQYVSVSSGLGDGGQEKGGVS